MRSHRVTLALLFALILPILAACGATAPAPMGTSGGSSPQMSNAPTAIAAPISERELMATAAPVPASLGDDAEKDTPEGDVVTASGGLGASDTDVSSTSTAPARPEGQVASLKAGEIDDNEHFADYLNYIKTYSSGGVRPVDSSERYLIRVIDDNQRPILNAKVSIYVGETLVFSGLTYAGGMTIFLPRVLNVESNANEFRVVASYGDARAETTFARGSSERIELGLRGVQSDPTLRLDLLFLLDTTGSMGDELGRIQETIDSIAQRIDAFTPRPQIRYSLVAYKDIGDTYVTYPVDFTTDLNAFRTVLNQLSAEGGGDTPEAVDEAIHDAIKGVSWSAEPAVRLVFLVADAAPNLNNQVQYTYLDGTRDAVAQGIKIYPIAASNTDAPAEYVFRQLAQQTLAGFIFLTYQAGESAGTPGETTPLEAGEQPYTVERLDDLIVSIVERELAAAVGAR